MHPLLPLYKAFLGFDTPAVYWRLFVFHHFDTEITLRQRIVMPLFELNSSPCPIQRRLRCLRNSTSQKLHKCCHRSHNCVLSQVPSRIGWVTSYPKKQLVASRQRLSGLGEAHHRIGTGRNLSMPKNLQIQRLVEDIGKSKHNIADWRNISQFTTLTHNCVDHRRFLWKDQICFSQHFRG